MDTDELVDPMDPEMLVQNALAACDPNLPEAQSIAQILSGQHAIHGIFGRVFERMGGEEFLLNWAAKNPTRFITLLVKMTPNLMPMSGVQGDVNLIVNAALRPTELDVVSEQ